MAGNPPNSRRPPAPAWVGHADSVGSDFLGSANCALILTYVPAAFTATQVGFFVGVQSGNMRLGFYDAAKVRLYQEPSFAIPAGGVQRKTLTTPVDLPEGPLYLAVQLDNGVAKLATIINAGPIVTFYFANTYAAGLPATLPALTDGSDAPALTAIATGF